MEYTRSSFESSGLDDRKCVFTFKNGETREGVLTTFINSEQFNFLPANCMSAYKRLENEKVKPIRRLFSYLSITLPLKILSQLSQL